MPPGARRLRLRDLTSVVRRAPGWIWHPSRVVGLIESLILLGVAEVAIRTVRIEKVAAWFGAKTVFTEPEPNSIPPPLHLRPRERTTLRVLSRVAPHWPFSPTPGGSCLRHSLAAAYVVRKHRPELRLGVSTCTNRGVVAHAWTEIRGTAVTNPGNSAPLLGGQARGAATSS